MSDAPEPWRLTDDEKSALIPTVSDTGDPQEHDFLNPIYEVVESIKEAAYRAGQVQAELDANSAVRQSENLIAAAALEDAAEAVDRAGVAFYDANGIALSTSEWLTARAAELRGSDA